MRAKLLTGLVALAGTLCAPQYAAAQTYTETFEDETHNSATFTNGGVTFNIVSIVSTMDIQGNYPGTGWSGTANDNKYIDNSSSVAVGSAFRIQSVSAGFKAQRFWIFLSNNSLNQSVVGTLTVTGKLGASTKFTQVKTTGFATSLGATNGYTLIDLTNLNGQNYSNITIDQLEITLGGAYTYAGFDAFTWTLDPLPLRLLNFDGKSTNNGNMLTWNTADERNTRQFSVEKSVNGETFSTIATIAANNTPSSTYSYTDALSPNGKVWYRLKMEDLDGSFTYSKTLSLSAGQLSDAPAGISPNPATGNITLAINSDKLLHTQALVTDIRGTIVQRIDITSLRQTADISTLPQGMYMVQFADGTSLKLQKQ